MPQQNGKILVLDEHRKKQFKKDIQQVFRRYGFDNGFWMCADNNPTTRLGTTVYMGHTNPLAEELRGYAEAIASLMREQAGHEPI
ncbi:MAG: hypothetical protein JWP57_721 [Spirosoma sp.]|nr:hypothetical protein [Spirosoma sp.]